MSDWRWLLETSSVEKDGSLYRNIHSKWNFWIRSDESIFEVLLGLIKISHYQIIPPLRNTQNGLVEKVKSSHRSNSVSRNRYGDWNRPLSWSFDVNKYRLNIEIVDSGPQSFNIDGITWNCQQCYMWIIFVGVIS